MKLNAFYGRVVFSCDFRYYSYILISEIDLVLSLFKLRISVNGNRVAFMYSARKLLKLIGLKREILNEYRSMSVKDSEGNVELIARSVRLALKGKYRSENDYISRRLQKR